MTPDATLPDFGRMTVPPLFGWQDILAGVVLVLVVGMIAFVLLATGRADSSRSEWEAWLATRSPGHRDRGDGPTGLPSSGGPGTDSPPGGAADRND